MKILSKKKLKRKGGIFGKSEAVMFKIDSWHQKKKVWPWKQKQFLDISSLYQLFFLPKGNFLGCVSYVGKLYTTGKNVEDEHAISLA